MKNQNEFYDNLDVISNFIRDYDPYEFNDIYGGKLNPFEALKEDTAKDPESVAEYLENIVEYGEGTKKQIKEAKRLLSILKTAPELTKDNKISLV